jgi:hypothetical protein
MTIACGGKAPAKAPPPRAAPPVQVVEEQPDLSPVERPKEVVALAQLKRPRAFIDTIAGWSNLPLDLDSALPGSARAFARVVAWEAPVHAVVALDAFAEGRFPKPLAVVSIGLESLGAALHAAEAQDVPTRKLAPGVYRIGAEGSVTCSAAVSRGTAPARLVCGDSQKDVDVLLPYATRGLSAEPEAPSDLHLRVDFAPLQTRYGRDVAALRQFGGVAIRELARDQPRFDRALSDAVLGGIDEAIALFGDLRDFELTAMIDQPSAQLKVLAQMRLKEQKSWTATTLAATVPALVPADLPKLPPDAIAASYTVALPHERFTPLVRVAAELAEGYLEEQKIPPASRKHARQLLEGTFAKMPEAYQFSWSPPPTTANSEPERATTVTRVNEVALRVTDALDDLAALLRDPALKKWAKQKLELDEKAWPKITKRQQRLPGFKVSAWAYEMSLDRAAWAKLDGPWSKLVEQLPAGGQDGKPLSLSIVVQPDATFTWIITAANLNEAKRVAEEQRKPSAQPFAPIPSGKVVSAGYFTLQAVAESLSRQARGLEPRGVLSKTPQRGMTRMPVRSRVEPSLAVVEMEIPAAVFGDAAAALAQAPAALLRGNP